MRTFRFAARPRALPRFSTVILAGFLTLAFQGAAVSQSDFLRGDANGDGKVTFADSSKLADFLFLGGELDCQSAGDIDDDGVLNITDIVRLMHVVILEAGDPCAPFPEPGPDPDGNALPCPTYGGGEPIDDPNARLEITGVAPGDDGRVTITLSLSSSGDVSGYSGVIAVESDVFSGGNQESRDLSGTLDRGLMPASVVAEKLHFAFLSSMNTVARIPAGQDREALEITVCLSPGTTAGDYALMLEEVELIDAATSQTVRAATSGAVLSLATDLGEDDGCPDGSSPGNEVPCGGDSPPPDDAPDDPPEPEGPAQDFVRGDANADGQISISDLVMIRRWLFLGDRPPTCLDAADVNDDGHLNVSDAVNILSGLFLSDEPPPAPHPEIGPDPTADEVGCGSYEPSAPEETDDVVRIGQVEGVPGEIVDVPVFLTNSVEVEAFQLVIAYDPTVFQPLGHTDGFSFDGTFYADLESGTHSNIPLKALDPEAADSVLSLGFVPSLIRADLEVPPGEDRLVFKFRGRVADDAPPGTTIDLVPTNEGVGYAGMRNELTHRGDARFVSTLPETMPGVLKIVGDITIFRGDSNDDDDVNIADAIHVLDFLFRGGEPPRCLDAADANDDGTLNVSDPIAILMSLFKGTSSIAPPYPERDLDPTPDTFPPCLPRSGAR